MDKNTKRQSLFEALNKNTNKKTTSFESLKEASGKHIIKTKKGYQIIKENSDLPLGYEQVNDKNYSGYVSALNALNLMITEDQKYVITKDVDVPSPVSQEMPTDEGPEELDLEDEDSQDQEVGDPIEANLSEYQELSGKLAYILKDEEGELDDYEAAVKYVFNTLLASVKLDQLNDSLISSFVDKLQSDTLNDDQEDQASEDEAPAEEQNLEESLNKKGYKLVETYTDLSFLEGENVITFNEQDDEVEQEVRYMALESDLIKPILDELEPVLDDMEPNEKAFMVNQAISQFVYDYNEDSEVINKLKAVMRSDEFERSKLSDYSTEELSYDEKLIYDELVARYGGQVDESWSDITDEPRKLPIYMKDSDEGEDFGDNIKDFEGEDDDYDF